MERNLERISKQLDMITKLLTTSIIEGKEFREQVVLLTKVGFQPKEIGDLLGKNRNTISVTLNLMKKSKKKVKK